MSAVKTERRGGSRVDLGEIARQYGPGYEATHRLSLEQRRVLRDLGRCRTAALGGHREKCDHCGVERNHYNSCRNRHCPACQGQKRRQWVEAEGQRLLPVVYFHVIFTLPHELNGLARGNPRLMYTLLFRAASEVLLEFGWRHLQGQIGLTAVLHSWGQTLIQHLHLHCIVTGGAFNPERQQWQPARKGYLFASRAVSEVFQGRFTQYLEQAWGDGKVRWAESAISVAAYRRQLHQKLLGKKWEVYVEPPMGGPERLVGYLGRYTQRVAIANNRIEELKDGKVSFGWKDYRDGKQKTMRLAVEEFLERYLLHVLPAGFVRIRHYGLMANGSQKLREACRQVLAECEKVQDERQRTQADSLAMAEDRLWTHCPECQVGRMIPVARIQPDPRSPPRQPGQRWAA